MKIEWQPIETVPTDGTEVLLYGPKFQTCKKLKVGSMVRDAQGELWSNIPEYCGKPTHWSPIPVFPKKGE